MSYIAYTDLYGRIRAKDVLKAIGLEDGSAVDTDAWAAVLADVERQINGRIAPLYAAFTGTVPEQIKDAAVNLACELIYLRLGFNDDRNPFAKAAADTRETLAKIGRGEQGDDPLDTGASAPAASNALVTEDSMLHPEEGRIML